MSRIFAMDNSTPFPGNYLFNTQGIKCLIFWDHKENENIVYACRS